MKAMLKKMVECEVEKSERDEGNYSASWCIQKMQTIKRTQSKKSTSKQMNSLSAILKLIGTVVRNVGDIQA